MPTILDSIIAEKKEEVRRLRLQKPGGSGRTSPKRPFHETLAGSKKLAVVAEVKKASPSKGVIAASFDPVAVAQTYEKGGAACISVLTDEKFFQGSLDYLRRSREKVGLPVLRKDFIIDPLQVFETAAADADAMLLIAAALGASQMQELYAASLELSLDPLIEVHTMKEVEAVFRLSPEPRLIGVNNRNLATFETDIETTLRIIKELPRGVTVISESGIATREQAQSLFKAGVKGVLVGESLMRAEDPGALIKELTE
jgi:indole-3-glycerol phosphate synthase